VQAQAARSRDIGFLAEAEMHARSGRQSPRDALATDATYAFARIFAAADVASFMRPEAIPQLQAFLRDADSGVRYWGAMGALMRGSTGVEALRAELSTALDDASPSVRIAAANAFARHGRPADLIRALATLQQCADPTKTSAYAGIAAMNVVEELGEKARPLLGFVRTMPTADPQALARGNDYVHRLKGMVLANFGEAPPPPPARKKR
jgi:uncharacterized sulfatase